MAPWTTEGNGINFDVHFIVLVPCSCTTFLCERPFFKLVSEYFWINLPINNFYNAIEFKDLFLMYNSVVGLEGRGLWLNFLLFDVSPPSLCVILRSGLWQSDEQPVPPNRLFI